MAGQWIGLGFIEKWVSFNGDTDAVNTRGEHFTHILYKRCIFIGHVTNVKLAMVTATWSVYDRSKSG